MDRRNVATPAQAGLDAAGALPVAWPSGAEIDGDVVAASLLEHARWLADRRAWPRPDGDRPDADLGELAGHFDEAPAERRVVESDARPCTEADERALRALRMARALRAARRVVEPDARPWMEAHERALRAPRVARPPRLAHRAVEPDARPDLETHERGLRVLRTARALRHARALCASTSRAP